MKSLFCLLAVATVAYAGSVKLEKQAEGTAGHLSSLTSAVDAQNINPNTQEIKQAPHARHARFCQGNSCACPQGNCVFEQPFTPPPNYVPKPGNHGSNGAGNKNYYATAYGASYDDYKDDFDFSEGHVGRQHGNRHFSGDCDGGKCNCAGGHCTYSQ